ncbi:unnamed protein product [Sphenostylis stenocarpa]|uniref:Uncharacterized protein n=1 Tax=Sphenostylis stenocarpa TaxID=92480 RepID=A0AA86W266_9FABA|nr:unnamed protein product [Sphenostylis stenocarpa]
MLAIKQKERHSAIPFSVNSRATKRDWDDSRWPAWGESWPGLRGGLRVETVRVEFAMERKEGWKRRRRGRGEVAKPQQLKALAMSRPVRWCRVGGGEGSGTVARWWCDHSGPEQRFTVTTGEA